MALARLIGQHGIRHSFDLDVYAASGKRKFPKAQTRRTVRAQRAVGWKDEEEGYAMLSKKRIRVRRIHNGLVNRFVRAIDGSSGCSRANSISSLTSGKATGSS